MSNEQQAERARNAKRIVSMLAEQGKLVEGGWLGLAEMLNLKHASKVQYDEMRKAFFMGAQHVYSSLLCCMDEGGEATEMDLRKLDLLRTELETFTKELLTKAHDNNS